MGRNPTGCRPIETRIKHNTGLATQKRLSGRGHETLY